MVLVVSGVALVHAKRARRNIMVCSMTIYTLLKVRLFPRGLLERWVVNSPKRCRRSSSSTEVLPLIVIFSVAFMLNVRGVIKG